MKNTLMIAVAAGLLAFSCGNSGQEAENVDVAAAAEVAGAQEFSLTSGELKWTGKKVTGEHFGTVAITEGILQADAGALKGGNFTIDMSSIKVEDLTDAKQNGDLVGHLKSPDFFAVDSHKVANFVITAVEALPAADAEGNTHTISGNLTIKGITNGIKFPAMVQMEAAAVKANAKFDIDRTLWNIRYGSGKFFKGLGDKMINDNITLNINLQAAAK
ncbi:MAG: YceI family protein [Bacteroidota bacterium]